MKKFFVFILVCVAATGAFAEFNWQFNVGAVSHLYGIIFPTGFSAEQYWVNPMNGEKELNEGLNNEWNDVHVQHLVPVELEFTRKNASAGDGEIPRSTQGRNGAYLPVSQGWLFGPTVLPNTLVETPIFYGGAWRGPDTGMDLTMLWGKNNVTSSVKWEFGKALNNLFRVGGVPGSDNGGRPDAPNYSFYELLNDLYISEYWLKADTNYFAVMIGNREGPGGRVQDFNGDFSTTWTDGIRFDSFGVSVANRDGSMGSVGPDFLWYVSNNRYPNRSTLYGTGASVVHMAGTLKLSQMIPALPFPMSFDLGFAPRDTGDLNQQESNNTSPLPEMRAGLTRVSGMFRLSGEGIADMLSVDLAYQLRGGDPTGKTYDPYDEELNTTGVKQPDGKGTMAHVIGLRVGLPDTIPDLAVSVGYTGLFRTYEDQLMNYKDDDKDNYTIKKKSPFYSGIDLRMKVSAIDDTIIIFNNNVSFAKANAPTYSEDEDGNDIVTVKRVDLYGDELGQYMSQSWFALYDALKVKYVVTGRLNFNLETVSCLSITTDTNSDPDRTTDENGTWGGFGDWGTRKYTYHNLRVGLYALHQFNSAIRLEAGVYVRAEQGYSQFSGYDEAPVIQGSGEFSGDAVPTSWTSGGVYLAFPINLSVSF